MPPQFQTSITEKDEYPKFDEIGLARFLLETYDSELGWCKKPFTSGFEQGKYGTTIFRINERGARFNPDYEKFPVEISVYGDSFVLSRQVNDEETIAHYLSKLTNSNILNFGVGNYGIDQGLLRMKREFPKNRTNIVILGFVPEQILRVMSYWKHYLEYGNLFHFKPRFKLENNKLKLIPNVMNNKEKYTQLFELLPEIRKHDYWYEKKFKKDFNVPYSFDQIMESNLNWRVKSYKDEECFKTLLMVIKLFKEYSQEQNFEPIVIVLPYKNDILYTKESSSNFAYYHNFIEECNKILFTIDLMPYFLALEDIDSYFSDNTRYGGHYSKEGNKFLASVIYPELENKGVIK